MYDSTDDIKAHIRLVWGFIEEIRGELMDRQFAHDQSKLQEPEKSVVDEFTPKLQEAEKVFGYGSPQYKQCVEDMTTARLHHFAANRHHPEHYPNGINGMSLLDIIEMLADWKAATVRNPNGSMARSLEINRGNFNISDQLYEILKNTVKEMGW
jgi:hypothetical protein